MRLVLSCLCVAAVLASPSARADRKYTMKDLEALVKSESWAELVDHLDDLAPAERDAKWQQIAEKGAIGFIDTRKTDNDPLGALIAADRLGTRYKFLLKSKPFLAMRTRAGLRGFEACYRRSYSGAPCNERIVPFVEADRGNVEFALKAGQLVARNQHQHFALPLFRLAVTWGPHKSCQAERVADAIIAGLKLPYGHAMALPGRDSAKACFGFGLRDRLLNELYSDSGYFLANACPLLKEKAALTKKQAEICAKAAK
jgi:hypothetical protein